MTDPNPCRIIGVLDDGPASLTPTALAHIRTADVIVGAPRTLALFESQFKPGATTHDLTGQLKAVPGWISAAREAGQRCVVLATGDPLCWGIAPYLAARLCTAALDILPNVSTLQLACARLGMPWQDARLFSVHAKDAGPWQRGAGPDHGLHALAQAVHAHDRLVILTSPGNTPARIAQLLQIEGLAGAMQMAVAENLLQPEERIHPLLDIDTAATMTFAPLNVVVLWRIQPRDNPVLLGLDDDAYAQRRPKGDGTGGLITKQEVRAVSLARLQLRTDSIVWDIGAGSGSVGLEAARLCRHGHVFAIEKNAADVDIIRQNHDAFGVANYTLVHDRAPSGMQAWPDPDAVFVGGSGGELAELIRLILRRLRPGGHLVMNFVTLENLATALETLKAMAEDAGKTAADAEKTSADAEKPAADAEKPAADAASPARAGSQTSPAHEPALASSPSVSEASSATLDIHPVSRPGTGTLHWDVLQLQAARSKPILHMNRLAAENPVWLVSACWQQTGDE